MKKGMIAPVIITVLLIVYYIAYFGLLISLLEGALKYLLGILPLLFSGVMIKVCLERLKEIKEGNEDDLSQY
jgi:hypothetical protein